MTLNSQTLQDIVLAITLIGGTLLYAKARIPKQTFSNQKDLIDTYGKRLKSLEDQKKDDATQQIENVKAIADLQGQVKLYKDLALDTMAKSMAEIASTNLKILDMLTRSSVTLAENTKTVAGAVRQVKVDLAEK